MKKLLIIAQNWPAPDYSAAGVRLMQLVTFFKIEGYKITIASTAEKREAFNSDSVETVNINLNHDSFNGFVKELNPDVVLFDRFMSEEQFGWRVSENVPNAIKILDTEDLHSLRKSREEALITNLVWTTDLWKSHELTKREVASILRCDLTLIISNFEIQLLEEVLPNCETLLLYLPFMVKTPSIQEIQRKPKFEERKDFLFIGFGGHSPNIDAINYLKKEIWPIIRKQLPSANLNVYGGNLPQKITELHSIKDGFLIKGWARDAHEVISNAKILLAPLRFGAGQKGKLLDAMLGGTPSITTSIGAEGMHNDLPWCGEIHDNSKAFAASAIKTYTNFKVWQEYQKNGQQILIENFDSEKLTKNLKIKTSNIQKNIITHRSNNFIGNLIQHQSMMGVKYMSKWIEEKNK
ncbi:glycosyltransferase [Aurantibacter sp.]|uniref:glycosyltransferase n=1 Tax=Aurantibacter sp. TaxID=2807103 RepID=UPI00326679DB